MRHFHDRGRAGTVVLSVGGAADAGPTPGGSGMAWPPARAGVPAARSLPTGGERRHGAPAQVGRLAGPGAAGGGNSLREGLEECFTINRLVVPPSLHRCLATTNLIESPQAGVRRRTRRVCRWRDAAMDRALGRRLVPGDGEELPPHHGLEGSLATGSYPGKRRKTYDQAGGRIT